MQFYTPLRYPGGKGRLAGFMKDVLRQNKLCDATYIEPYAGGAAVALNLLIEEYAWRVVINDIDPLIFAFWHTVLHETEWLLKKINDTPVNIDEWYKQRGVHGHPTEHSQREIGFATFFMNRTNRSGIIKAGVIGGKNQDGPYKITARFNKKDLSDRILKIASYKKRITVTNLDAMELIARDSIWKSERNFIYLDPPYYKKGSMLYANFYSPMDHKIISETVKELNVPWILTYDNVPEVHALYSKEKSFPFTLSYSASKTRKKGKEVLFYNGLKLPSGYATDGSLHFKTR